MADAGIKVNRIKAANRAHMNLLKEIVAPDVLHERVPRLASVMEARVEHRNKMNEIQQWGQLSRATGFTPDKSMQYVAQIDASVWSVIVETFGKTDPETGELMEDGLLYKMDERGNLVLNRDFFYALVAELQGAGYECDMRGQVKLV